jgi:hypothetical protein
VSAPAGRESKEVSPGHQARTAERMRLGVGLLGSSEEELQNVSLSTLTTPIAIRAASPSTKSEPVDFASLHSTWK